MRPIDADKLPVQKIYHVDEAGYGATFYMVDIEDIKAAPRIAYADIVPRGKWGFDAFTAKHGEPYRCSECKEVYSDMFNFCPNCGARMIGEKK